MLENRIALLAVLGLVEFALLWAWARWRTPRTQRLATGGFVVACLLLMIQALVVTDREKITSICHEMAGAMEDGDVDGFATHIAGEFLADTIDRDVLLAELARVLERVQVEDPRLTGFEVSTDGNRARAIFQARCRLVTPEFIEGIALSRWELTFQRAGERWRVIEMRPVPIPSFPFSALDQVFRQR